MNYLFLVLTAFFTCADHGEFTFRGQDYRFEIQDHAMREGDESSAFFVSIFWDDDSCSVGLPAPEEKSICVYLEMVEDGIVHIYGFVREEPIYEVFISDPNNPQRWVSADHEFTLTSEGMVMDGAKPIKFPKLNVKTTQL